MFASYEIMRKDVEDLFEKARKESDKYNDTKGE